MNTSLTFAQFNPNNPQHLNDAATVSMWTRGAHMIELTPAAIAGHVVGVFGYDPGGVVGYRGVTQEYPGPQGGPSTFEIGGLITDPSKRGQGYGRLIAAKALEIAMGVLPQGAKIIAFCNSKSAPISEALGMTAMPVEAVPPAALALCQECPMYPKRAIGQICCDTILGITVQ